MFCWQGSIHRLIIIIFVCLFAAPAFSDQQEEPSSNQYQGSGRIQHNQIELTEGEKTFLQSHPVIRFGTDETWEPFASRDSDGILRGVDVDFIRYINELTGSNIQLVTGPWADIVKKAKKREIDGLVTSAPLKAREPFFNFSDVYVSEFMIVIIPFDSSFEINNLSDLSGKTVAIQKGNEAYAALLKPYPAIKIMETDSDIESTKMVVEGKADASISGTSTYKTTHKHFLQSIKIGYVASEKPLDLVFSIRKDWPKLLSIINKSLASIPQETINTIYLRWFGMNFPVPGIHGKRSIRTLIVDNYYPYTFVNESGEPDGFSVDLMRAVAQVMGFKIRINVGSWQQAINELKTGEIDFLPMMAYSEERDKAFDFSAPHTIAYDAFFTRKGSLEITSLNDLRQKKIIVMKNDQAHDYLSSLGYIRDEQLILTDDLQDALGMLAAGKGDTALMPKLVGLIFIRKLNLTNLALAPLVVEEYKRPFSIAVKEGNQDLLERFSQGLSILKETHQQKEIYEKWFGGYEPGEISFTDVLKYFFWFILAFILIGAVLFFWSISLKRQVSIRTKDLKKEIEDRRRAEEALRESEEKLRTVIEHSNELFYIQDTKHTLTYVSQTSKDLLGYAPGKMMIKWTELATDNPINQKGIEIAEKAMATGEKQAPYLLELKKKDGTSILLEIDESPVKDAAGKVVAISGAARDVTAQRRTEKRLLKSEKGFRDLFDSITDLIYTQDLDGRFTSINRAMCKVFGYEKDELIGRPASDFMKPEMKTFFQSGYLEQIKTKGSHEGITSYFTKNGEEIYIDYRSALIDSDDGVPYITGTGRDVTERMLSRREIKRLQNQVHQSQKMEAIGLMAGGVAHDLNNILSGIVTYPELLLMDLPEGSPLRKPIKTIQESGMRAADVVADLLTVARGVAMGKEVINLNSQIEGYLDSAEHRKLAATHPSVTFKTEIAPDLLNVSCSPTHIKKALMNLVANASEAIQGSGIVTISTTNRYLDEPLKGHGDVRIGEYAVLTVSDNGSGITPKDLERIFEPFYTKKVMGMSGTGLGLAVVWNTVQDHKGCIDVKSGDKGTVFELYFPVTRQTVVAEKKAIPLKDYLGHGEKILVVDDEERQREIACRILTRLGYNAEAVSSGEETIEYLKEKQVDLIVLDMVMPKGINGRETYEAIIKICPGQKAILASGFSESEEVKMAQKSGAGSYIKKPYILEKIGVAVKAELEKRAT
jgi:PAS domain S-box-containing protein